MSGVYCHECQDDGAPGPRGCRKCGRVSDPEHKSLVGLTVFSMLFLFCMVLLCGISAFARPLKAKDFGELERDRNYVSSNSRTTKIPKKLFRKFEHLEHLTRREQFPGFDFECPSVQTFRVLDRRDGQVFTVWYTNEDDCDGGNSLGVIVEGLTPTFSKARYRIEDSFFYPIEK